VIRLVVGILKGAVIGGAVGYGAYALDTATGFANPWLTYGAIGAQMDELKQCAREALREGVGTPSLIGA